MGTSIFLNFLSPLLIILGIAGLVVLLLSTKEEEDVILAYRKRLLVLKEKKRNIQERIFKKIFSHSSKVFLNTLEKSLLRLRIVVLRIDNALFCNLRKLREIKLKKTLEEKKFPVEVLNHFEEEQKANRDLKKEERTLLGKLKKNDPNTFQNLARLYLYEEDFPSARWIILEGFRRFKDEKIFQAFLVELFEKEKFYPKEENK
ncbi:MAG: hypothetical protein ACPLXL_01140 [Minisyncoccia bacterium]